MTTHFNSKNLLEPDGFLSGIHLISECSYQIDISADVRSAKGVGKIEFLVQSIKRQFRGFELKRKKFSFSYTVKKQSLI